MLIETAHGPRYALTPQRLRETLVIEDDTRYRKAVELLCNADPPFLYRHRWTTAARSPLGTTRGFTLPKDWSSEHVLVLRRESHRLLEEHGHAAPRTGAMFRVVSL